MVTAREVRATLDERPDLEPAVEAALAADEPFTFDDLPMASGPFGELVSRGLVVETDGGYRVADRGAVRRGLDGEVRAGDEEAGIDRWSFDRPTIDRRTALALAGALAVVVAFRLVSFPSVYREGAVVLSGNDPYFYRYWVEQLLADPETTLSTLPGGAAKGEPLLIATLWLLTELFGGTADAAGHVLAWYPVVAAVLVGLFTYTATVLVTDDRRVGLAAVLLLAVVPGHALRTSLGYPDHHAFDFVWLTLTALSLVVIVHERELSPRSGLAAAGVAVGVAGQTLAWDASPLLLVALGLFLAADALVAVWNDRSPLHTGGPAIAGVAVAAVVVWLAHRALGWHTDLVASAPALLLLGGIGVVAAGTVAHRLDLPAAGLAAVEVVGAVVGVAALAVLAPEYWNELARSVTDRLLAPRAIAEVQTLFGDSFGWLLLFGLVLVLALPYMAWGTYRAREEPRWLPVAVYGWYFLLLAAIQVRFVGELAPFAALFAGLGFVHLAERIEVARLPAPFADGPVEGFSTPDSRQLGALLVLFLLVGGLGALQVPVKVSQITVPAEQYGTATWMADHADERGWEHPANYVFSPWSQNRHYNYFVSGQSRSYSYAQTNYVSFANSDDAAGWYDRLNGRTGFVVTQPDTPTEQGTLGRQLHHAFGSRTADRPALEHYRARYVSPGGGYKVFTLEQGAVLRGEGLEPNATVVASTSVDIEGASFEYEQQVETDGSGAFEARVPYPGEYTVGNRTVTVAESDVRTGGEVTAG